MRYNESDKAVKAFLVTHPSSTAEEIRQGTGLPIATINYELQRNKVGGHEEPRYEMDGFRMGPNGRPAQAWRLAAEPKASAKRRLREAVKRIGAVLAEHPELAGEAVTWVAAVAAQAARKSSSKPKAKR
jgi:hypothetical protein